MRITRIVVGLLVAALVGLGLLAVSAGAATTAKQPVQHGCKKPGELGSYFSPWGHATFSFSQKVDDELDRLGATIDPIKPVQLAGGGKAIYMPIGVKEDNFGTGGELYYPGGFTLATADRKHSFTMDCFWLKALPGGVYTAPKVDGVQQPEMQLATFDPAKVLLGLRPSPTEGGFTIENWRMNFTPQFANLLNGFGAHLKGGDQLGTLVPVLKYLPLRKAH